MASCSNLVSRSGRPRWPSRWRSGGGRRHKAGRPSFTITPTVASIDLFVVPTVSFRLLYGLLILQHARRDLLWLAVTAHPTAEWMARQFTEAVGWRDASRYVVRDRDRAYGSEFIRRAFAHGHSRSADCGAFALAERICGEADRLYPTRVPRPCSCLWRTACSTFARRDRPRAHSDKPGSRWTTSPILPCLSFRQGQGLAVAVN